MEGDHNNKRFVCKFCNRRFQCGKSLGGHIRTHLNKKQQPTREQQKQPEQTVVVVEEHEQQDEFARVTLTAKLSSFDNNSRPEGQSGGYRLRENPKKTWRFADHKVVQSFQFQQEKVCKECGKGFMSLKALCGHMACHSEKGLKLQEIEEEFSETKLVMDSQSDTETSSAPTKQRRVSKRLRGNHFEVHLGGGCSSGSGVEQEQQEVAISLMMLSCDSGYKGGLNSFGESSDNNSVILEGKSSSIDMRMSSKRGLSSYAAKVNDVMDLKRAREKKKLKYEEVTVSDNSDSGYYIHEPKKVDSDVSVDGFVRNGELKKCRGEFGSGYGGYESYDVKSTRGLSIKSEMMKEVPPEEAYEQVDRGSLKYALRKSTKNGFHRPFTSGSSSVEVHKNVKKSIKYQCLTCNKTFHSHRALGGHRASHTKSNDYSESLYESGENSIDSDESLIPTPERKLVENNKSYKGKTPVNQDIGSKKSSRSKRSKRHECPFCFKVFKSGQALGGHKRSHFVGGCEVKTVVLGQEDRHQEEEEEEEDDDDDDDELEVPENEAEIPTLFDLNLPAPMEEEANGNFEYMSW